VGRAFNSIKERIFPGVIASPFLRLYYLDNYRYCANLRLGGKYYLADINFQEDKTMSCIAACDIMHPRLSLPQKAAGPDVIKKLLAEYPALPVVNENQEVVGIVSEYDILDAATSSAPRAS
jgi:CBS domain-containing protein